MKSFGATLALAGAASAAAIQSRAAPVAQCCFGINVNGAVSGSVGQLSDGQNRVGSGFGGAQYCYYPSTTSIVDESGRGCIATNPTSQYQCDAGLTATTATSGITLASNGSIEHNGSAVWYECNSGNGYNIYTMNPGSAATQCSQITLDVSGGNCTLAASSSAAASTSVKTATIVSTSTRPASTTTASVASPTTATVATPTTATVATPTTLISATTVTPPVSVSTQVSVQSCVPSTVTVTVTAPAPPAATVTAPTPPAATVTAPAPPAMTVTAPAPPAMTVTAPAPPAATVTAPAPPAATVTVQGPCTSAPVATGPSPPVASAPTASPPAVSAPVASPPAGSVTPAPGASSSTSTRTLQSTLTLTQSASGSAATGVVASSTKATPTAPAATACATPNSNGNYGCPDMCPLDLSTGDFQYPHLLEINGQNGYFGEVNATAKTDFTFDIPASYAGKTCNAYFALPTKSMLVTSDYTLSTAPGAEVYFSMGGKQVASCSPAPGNSVLVSSGPCAAGKTVSYEMTADASVDLRWFQDYNACAIGLFVVPS